MPKNKFVVVESLVGEDQPDGRTGICWVLEETSSELQVMKLFDIPNMLSVTKTATRELTETEKLRYTNLPISYAGYSVGYT